MRITNRILLTVALGVLAASCSQQESAPVDDAEYVKVPVTLSVGVSDGMNLMSRATSDYQSADNPAPRRPVSWKGEQSINDLRVYVFSAPTKDGEYLYVGGGECPDGGYRIEEFMNSTPWASQQFESHVYYFAPRIQKGKYYKFLCVGRDDINGAEIPSRNVAFIPWGTKTMNDLDFKVNETELHSAMITNGLRQTHYPYINTEIFTGIMTYTDASGALTEDYIYVEDNKHGFNKDIELKRAVAGLWIYVTDIPTEAIDNSGRNGFDGTVFSPNEMTLHMPVATNELNLASRSDTEGGRYIYAVQIGYVDLTNRYGEKGGKVWYKNENSSYWQRDVIDNYLGVKIDANCALMANFLLPINTDEVLTEEEATFTLQLREYETDYVFTRRVKCHIESITDPVTGEVRPYKGEEVRFPIIANYLYTIGTPDEPYSLAKLGTPAQSRTTDDPIEMTVHM